MGLKKGGVLVVRRMIFEGFWAKNGLKIEGSSVARPLIFGWKYFTNVKRYLKVEMRDRKID